MKKLIAGMLPVILFGSICHSAYAGCTKFEYSELKDMSEPEMQHEFTDNINNSLPIVITCSLVTNLEQINSKYIQKWDDMQGLYPFRPSR